MNLGKIIHLGIVVEDVNKADLKPVTALKLSYVRRKKYPEENLIWM